MPEEPPTSSEIITEPVSLDQLTAYAELVRTARKARDAANERKRLAEIESASALERERKHTRDRDRVIVQLAQTGTAGIREIGRYAQLDPTQVSRIVQSAEGNDSTGAAPTEPGARGEHPPTE